ncbi:MAG TPA: hypothetical protein VIU11_12675, partial [Nakamurella sp.]
MSTNPILPAGVQARPDGKLIVRWRQDGKQKGRVFATLTEAKAFNLAVRAELARGGRPDAGATTADTLAAWWNTHTDLRA